MDFTRTSVAALALMLVVSPAQAGERSAGPPGKQVSNLTALSHTNPEVPQLHDPTRADYPVKVELEGATVYAQNNRRVDDVQWALSRYVEAGIELPFVQIWMHGTRSGCAGSELKARSGFATWRDGTAIVFVCNSNYTLLHELGHVFDRHALSDADRERFMALRGVGEWQAGAWLEQGQEHLADVLAWGLGETATRYGRTQPNDEASIAAAFIAATGVEPLSG